MESISQIKMQIKCDKEVQESKHFALIQDMDQRLQERFPGGAINRLDVIKSQGISNEEVERYLATFMVFGQELDDAKNRTLSKLADITQPLVFAHCGLFTNYATGYLQNKYPNLTVETLFFDDNHTVALIGRNKPSNTFNPKNCGKDVIIFDFWAGKSYLAMNLPKVQKENDIPFYNASINNYNNQVTGLVLHQSHYLAGTTDICCGDANDRYEKMVRAWVEEDQKRFKQAQFSPLKSPLPLKTPVDSNQIKNALTHLSKCSGWKYSQQTGFAWLECKDNNQADRIVKALKAAKFAEITLCTKPNDKIPFVKCEHIDHSKLNKLATVAIPEQKMDIEALMGSFKI